MLFYLYFILSSLPFHWLLLLPYLTPHSHTPFPIIALKMQVKDKHHVLNSQTAFPLFCISSFRLLIHSPTCAPCVYMHVPSISYIPQNTDCVSLHVRVIYFTSRIQVCFTEDSTGLYYKELVSSLIWQNLLPCRF